MIADCAKELTCVDYMKHVIQQKAYFEIGKNFEKHNTNEIGSTALPLPPRTLWSVFLDGNSHEIKGQAMQWLGSTPENRG